MVIIYDLIFLAFVILYLPVFLFRKKLHPGFPLRLGILPKNLKLDRPIWIHAVSVGEAMATRSLIDEIRKVSPHKRLIISTVTHTGNKVARGIAKENDFVIYLPLDFSFIVRRVIDRINPSIFIIAETELWPNLITHLHRKKIPVVVVNGRISDSSFKGYLAVKFLLKSILKKISLFCVQTERDAKRLSALGVAQNNIRVTGNMKFDSADYTDKKFADYADKYRITLGLGEEEKLFVAGSTHYPEEEIVLDVYKNLSEEFTNLRLLIAPRHPQRAREIEKIVIKYGFNPLRVSQLNRQTGKLADPQTVFILDTVGQLLYFYGIADIVFVGGSLIKKGGHNILEPASLGRPVLFGPYMFNFRDIADLFLQNQACLSVHNKEELETGIRDLLNSPSIIEGMSKRAKDLIRQNQGATKRTLLLIQNLGEGG